MLNTKYFLQQFTFNYSCEWAMLIIHDLGGMSCFLHIKEVLIQGEPLDIISYGIIIIPLLREICVAHPRVTQLWYANDAEAVGLFEDIWYHLEDRMSRGPDHGYFPETSKIVLIVSDKMFQWFQMLLWGMSLKVVTGSYLFSFIGDTTTWDTLSGYMVQCCERAV